ncbi:DnaJ-domain-containing protein [Microthyrium microscopicum]|uniref:DnaJ-domain-containing protein n=1 Tax=Microthyrium microscopicum TaxID=703497 RepID=A0A6A6UJK8_9PEZI|nr:DnaJ-domain-containing protein [Microthyrium microscopicum]
MSSSTPPDYYSVLGLQATATQAQIREAYKKAALKTHPDRVPSDSPERPARTKRFQQVNDAYYTLADATRRRDYDDARRFHGYSSTASTAADDDDPDEEIPRPGGMPGGFNWGSWFGGQQGAEEREKREQDQFGSAFEEMLREEGLAEGESASPTGKFWSLVGGLSGGALGFIMANFPGAVAGAVAGNRLGAIRDTKGKSVYDVFRELPQADKARLLSDLAAKVFAHAVSG